MTLLAIEIGALIALLTGLWSQIAALAHWLSGWLIVRHRVDYPTASLILAYLRATARWRAGNGGVHSSEDQYVRPLDRMYRVFYLLTDKSSQWFLSGRRGGHGRRLIRYSYRGGTASGGSSGPEDSSDTHVLAFSFVRGTVDWHGLLAATATWETLDVDRARRSRARVQRWFGATEGGNEAETTGLGLSSDHWYDRALIGWSPEDVGHAPADLLATLELTPDLQEVVAEIRAWREARAWYRERGITWRRGYLLEGPPGTGKTALVRAIGQMLGTWTNVIDVASMTSRDLARAWRDRYSSDGLAIVVLEDFDCVFDGRDPAECVRISYDAVLQVLDGVEQADGVLLFVTANHPKRLDPALLRPGRIDRRVAFAPIGREGLLRIAERILGEGAAPESQEGETPAVYQERCVRLAIERRFG